jgi:hypothetical protein
MAQVKLGLVAQGGWQRCDITFPNAAVALATLRRWRAEDEAAGHPYSQVWAEETEELQWAGDHRSLQEPSPTRAGASSTLVVCPFPLSPLAARCSAHPPPASPGRRRTS